MIGEDILKLRKALKMRQSDFCDKFKISQPYLSEIETGKKPVPYELEESIYAEYGEKIKDISTINVPKAPNRGLEKGYITYLLPQSAMGGNLIGIPVDGVLLDNCERVISPIENVDFAITIYGESMYPEYPSGSRVLVKKINPNSYIAWGNVYVLDTSNGVILKEVQPSDKEGYIQCVSFNPNGKYKPFDVPKADIYGMYRVLACVSAK